MRSNHIIDHNITEPLVNWVNANESMLARYQNESHSGVVYWKAKLEERTPIFEQLDFPYDNLSQLEKEIKKLYDLPDASYETIMGIMLIFAPGTKMSENFNGYKCTPHKDPNTNSKNDVHTRFNIMISSPIEGGNPIIENNVIEVNENEPWICVAGLHLHSTMKMYGDKSRIVLSFGYWYSKEFLESRGWVDMYKNLEI